MATSPSEGDPGCSCGEPGGKERIREVMRRRRRALDPKKRRLLNRDISLRLFCMPEYERATQIMFYASFAGEVCTWAMMGRAMDEGKRVCLPRTDPVARGLTPVGVRRCGARIVNLTRGAYGISEPTGPGVDPASLDLVCVPALAYDREGFRVGYGGGYYDRFLEGLPGRTVTVGLGHSFQVLQRVPRGEHDLPVDVVVTEMEVIDCRPGHGS